MIPGPVDDISTYLIAIGQTAGPTPDMWAEFLRDLLSDPTGGVDDLENQYLSEILNTTGTTPDLWKEYLDNRGFTGPVDDMAKQALGGDGLLVGPELVTNGGFDTDTGWAKNGQWTIANGVAAYLGTDGGNTLVQFAVLEAGRRYLVTFTVVAISSGTATVLLGSPGADGIVRTTAGTFIEEFNAAGDAVFRMRSGGLSPLSIDNISTREVLS